MRSPRKKGPEKGDEARSPGEAQSSWGTVGPRGSGSVCISGTVEPPARAAPGSHARRPLSPCPVGVCRGAAGEAGGKEESGEKKVLEAGSGLPGGLGPRKSRTEKWPLKLATQMSPPMRTFPVGKQAGGRLERVRGPVMSREVEAGGGEDAFSGR